MVAGDAALSLVYSRSHPGGHGRGSRQSQVLPQKLPDKTRLFQRRPGQPPGAGAREMLTGLSGSPAWPSRTQPPPSVSTIVGPLICLPFLTRVSYDRTHFILNVIHPRNGGLNSVLAASAPGARRPGASESFLS